MQSSVSANEWILAERDFDSDEEHIGVIVLANAFARIPFSRTLFCRIDSPAQLRIRTNRVQNDSRLTAEEFARCLACWMSPGVLARAAGDWSNRPDGHEIINLWLATSVLTSAADGRFDWFVRQFLEHLNIPEELIRYTHGIYPQHVTPHAADWLRSFKFTGDVKFNPEHPPQALGGTVLAAISAPLCEVRVVWPPIQMLNELVSVKADYWRRIASMSRPEEVHHEPIGEWPFEAWVDLQVARACGFPAIGRAGMVPPINLIQNVRGQVSIAGELPKDGEELSMISLAASLHPQSQSRGFDLYQALKMK